MEVRVDWYIVWLKGDVVRILVSADVGMKYPGFLLVARAGPCSAVAAWKLVLCASQKSHGPKVWLHMNLDLYWIWEGQLKNSTNNLLPEFTRSGRSTKWKPRNPAVSKMFQSSIDKQCGKKYNTTLQSIVPKYNSHNLLYYLHLLTRTRLCNSMILVERYHSLNGFWSSSSLRLRR